MESKPCPLCDSRPYATMVLHELVINCPCGNILKVLHTPAIYVGIVSRRHVCILPFPGCVVCGRPMNLPWSVALECQNEAEQHMKFQEVYHNYGGRN